MTDSQALPVPARYRKKPVVIEAMQMKAERENHIVAWINRNGGAAASHWDGPCIIIDTLEGKMRAYHNDYIIRGIKGEFYPCKPHIFEATYEPA